MSRHIIGEEGADQYGLLGKFDLALDVAFLVQAFFLGFLSQDFAADQFFLDGILQFWRIRRALGFLLGDKCVIDRLRDRLAVDGSKCLALRESRGGNNGASNQQSGQT